METTPRLTRLSVNMNSETAGDLKLLAERRGLSFTETVRRMVSVAKFLDDEIMQGHVIQVVDKAANQVRELVIA
ncbi:CopG family transcriptional regulator [Curtobacterium sp. MCLR17_034]|uniref:CopG family transcriptional regulator n=1 Tax=Curtobacterium sp. MCLR17_034 TaxID=2175623 RepID=UPI0011B5739B|nr:CopG family transcriptional regulator [Curtobacterium sp. MCLR17_034]